MSFQSPRLRTSTGVSPVSPRHRDRATERLRRVTLAAALFAVWSCSDRDKRAERENADSARARRCGEASNAVVSATGVGPARLGMRLSEIAAVCTVTDTTAPGLAGDSSLASTLHIGRHSALLVSGRDSIIASIILADSAFRTDRGIGVGSRIRTLRFAYGRVCAVDQNGEAMLAVAGLDGITFSFDPSSLPTTVYRTRILGPELRTDAADDLPVRGMRIGPFKSPCREQRVAIAVEMLAGGTLRL